MGRDRPKIGLALSGGSGRAIAHIGVLEVLRENNIPIDYITACSSGALIAASYACGTMEQLKQEWTKLDKKFFLNMMELDKSRKGIFSLEKLAEYFSRYTLGKNFEDVTPRLGFVATDIITRQPVLLALGPILKAGQASCAVPGLFEPVEWGSKLLVDGGLFNIVPTTQAGEMGADIVLGVDIASTRYMFSQKFLRVRKGYNFFRNSWPVRLYAKLYDFLDWMFTKSVDFIYYNQSDILEEGSIDNPRMFAILGRAIDLSIKQSEKHKNHITDCDYIIAPDVKRRGSADFENASAMLEEGRRVTEEAIPDIRKLLRDYDWRRKEEKKLKTSTINV